LIARAAQQSRRHGRRRDSNKQDMVETDAIETIFEREYPLDFVRLNHGGQEVADGVRTTTACVFVNASVAGHEVRYRQKRAKIIRRMPPFGRQPCVIIIKPANQRADIECRRHRV
jgi:hypothetical protein